MIDENLCFASAFEHKLITLQEDFMSIIMDDIIYAEVKERIWKDSNYILIFRELTLKKPFIYPTVHKNGLLKIQFELEGYSSYKPILASDANIPIEILAGHFNLFYMPYIEGNLQYTVDRSCVDLMLPVDFLLDLQLACPIIKEKFGQALANGTAFKLFDIAHPIPFKIKQCLKEIIDNAMPISLSRSYFGVKIKEIILLVFQYYYENAAEEIPMCPEIKGAEKAVLIKRWIVQNLHESIDIEILCKQFNSNPTSLNRLFKQYFNTTARKFVFQHRMEWACEALTGGNLSIKEIASLCQYEHPHHFTYAFKKYVGKIPREYKRTRSSC